MRPAGAGYTPKGFDLQAGRHVDFIGSYPPGDLSDGDAVGADA